VKRGAAFSEKANYAEAISTLKKARELAPRDYTVNLLLGLDLLRSGRPKEAIEPLRIAAELRPQDGTPEGYLGKALAAVHEFAPAAEAFQGGISRSPDSAELWTEWADFDLERFRILGLELRSTQGGMATVLRLEAEGLKSGPETREELLQQSATANPEQIGIWGELGVEQLRRGMREQAAAALMMARERQPQASWTVLLEAMMAAAAGDWRNAESRLLDLGGRSRAALSRAMQSWPRNLAPQEGVAGEIWECARKGSTDCLARITFSEGETSKPEEQLFAEERWDRLAAQPEPSSEGTMHRAPGDALKRAPTNSPPGYGQAAAWLRRGIALAELNDYERAIPALERGVEPGAETAAFWLELCYAAEAKHAVDRLSALGNRVAVHRLRGDILVRIDGDALSATEEYAKAIHLSPKDPGLSERLAQAYMSLGEMQRAQQAAREALTLDPHRRTTLRLLASIAMNEKDYPGALVLLNQMLAIDPNDAWTRVQTGIAYAQTGQAEQALRHLQPVLAAGYPDERGALHATLAGVLRKLGREQEAQNAAAEANRLSNRFQQHGQTSVDDHQ
jgi:tetratricopeptide (TPR) repeat protein